MAKKWAIKKFGSGSDMEDNELYNAALDLGTNTFNLAISNSNKPFNIVFRTEKGVFLGKGGLAKKEIQNDAIIRAQKVLKEYSTILSNYSVKSIRCVATEALRNASNAHEVLDHLQINTPYSIETIAGEKEALLIYKGVLSTGLLNEKNSLIMDIGGGSVEFIIGNQKTIHWKKSVKIGISRVLESHPLSNPPLDAELQEHRLFFKDTVSELVLLLHEYDVSELIGTAGSFDCWRKILKFNHQSNDATCKIDQVKLHDLIARINSISIDERCEIEGMEEMRKETIVPAGVLVAYLLDSFNFESISQCSYSLSEGVLWEMLNN